MIEIIGTDGTPEFAAAEQIAGAFERLWPGVATSATSSDHIIIAAGAKLSGYRVSDIDLVIAAQFTKKRYFIPKTVFKDSTGAKVTGSKIAVSSILCAIEVKDHDAARLRIEAGGVQVRYKKGWKSATEQNENQRYAIMEYFKDLTGVAPWVYRCVLLRGIDELPRIRGRFVPDSGAAANSFDGSSILMAMASVNGIAKRGAEYAIRSAAPTLMSSILDAPLFKKITPSRLDRRRMDHIASRPPYARELATELGDRPVHLRGKGGTGKTVLLLQAAYEAYQQTGKSALVLTYNHALAADIQRLMALMSIPASSEQGGIEVRTVMSFIYAWLNALGVVSEPKDYDLAEYDRLCLEALELIEQGAVTRNELDEMVKTHGGSAEFDFILVDEAQDWPQPEAELLVALFGQRKITIADGVDQLVRGGKANWKILKDASADVKMITFDECLRMKRNLAVFANELAIAAGLNWSVEPNTKAAGGRVLISVNAYESLIDLNASLIETAKSAGNDGIDILHCVPASSVTLAGNQKVSSLASALKKRGYSVWDGVDPLARKDYPRSTDELRVVQYESSRGLEGWVTVLDHLDEFWERKYQEASLMTIDPENSVRLSHLEASAIAWRWVMIGLTRPIDTLVITVKDPNSILAKTIFEVCAALPDVVEIID